jgi:hypothetical protein
VKLEASPVGVIAGSKEVQARKPVSRDNNNNNNNNVIFVTTVMAMWL